MKTLLLAAALIAVPAGTLHAQESEPESWKFTASLSPYIFPSDEGFLLPILSADRGALHLEARYNYEARESGSLFVGRTWNWESGKLAGEFTPIVGLVVGDVAGVAPGLKLDLLLDPVEFYTEGEFMMDFGEGGSSFIYFWSELSVWPTEWLRGGLVSQRTRVVETQLDFQRGFLVGTWFDGFGASFYMFNPQEEEPYYVVTLQASF